MINSTLDNVVLNSTVIDEIWSQQPAKSMFISDDKHATYNDFLTQVNLCKTLLADLSSSSVAMCIDNSISWIVVDFACQQLGIVLLPLPHYFSAQQIQHSITTAGCDLLIVDAMITEKFIAVFPDAKLIENETEMSIYLLDKSTSCLPNNTSKITFTSGTTGQPKGACLSTQHQWLVAKCIADSISNRVNKHLCVLPLATLLENIAGIYAPLINGATVEIPSLSALGFVGSSSLNFEKFIQQINQSQPASLITTPEILKGLVQACQMGWQAPQSLQFIAVGGAHTAQSLLDAARKCGLPAFQGYGLSECCSVVSLNTTDNINVKSAGKSLAHLDIEIIEDEIVVKGPLFLGYVGDKSSWNKASYETGDLGYIDNNGYLFIQGRKKNTLVSSFGRNINPEWIEASLLAYSQIKQTIVFGDAKPFCSAGIYVDESVTSSEQVSEIINTLNEQLPDYAQIKSWFYLPQLILPNSELMTANGRIRRNLAAVSLSEQLKEIYGDNTNTNTNTNIKRHRND